MYNNIKMQLFLNVLEPLKKKQLTFVKFQLLEQVKSQLIKERIVHRGRLLHRLTIL